MNYISPEKSSDELYSTYGWRLAARKENVDNQKPIADRSSTASKKDNQDLQKPHNLEIRQTLTLILNLRLTLTPNLPFGCEENSGRRKGKQSLNSTFVLLKS